MEPLNLAVIVKLEPDFSEGNVSYKPDGTLNRNETKSTLGPHSGIAAKAAFYAKVKYGAKISVCSMGPPLAELALEQAQQTCDADVLHLYSDRIFAGADTLATAETLRTGITDKMQGKMDIVFSGHRASDGETGQTGPQTAWKLGFTFLGNVISYDVNLEKRTVVAKCLLTLNGVPNVIEEIEAPLPVFISIDPSYKSNFTTVSQRIAFEKYQKEAYERARNNKQYLKVFNDELGVDKALVGLAGSPTIVYQVERIPKGKATRQAEVLDGSNPEHIRKAVAKMKEALSAMVIK